MRGRSRRCRFTRRAGAPLVVALAGVSALGGAVSTASAAAPAAIVYQCPDGQHICAITPSGGTPSQLAQAGLLAGVTRDGLTYGYAASSSVPGQAGLWEAPVGGGAPTEVNSAAIASSVGSSIPVMSPDGSEILERDQQFSTGFNFDSDTIEEFRVAAGASAKPTVLDSSTLFGMTYGWLGAAAITTHSSDAPLQPPSWACVGYVPVPNDAHCASTDPTAKLQSATQTIDTPDGSPDGSEIVAALGAPGSSGGSIALFSASTGALIRTVATPPPGVEYTTPRFSPDGTKIVLEVDATSPSGAPAIAVVGVDGGQPTTLTQGSDPFWGGTGSATPTPPPPTPPRSKRPLAARPTLRVARRTLATVRRTRRLVVTCTLKGAGTCTVTATITAASARHLGLAVGRRAGSYRLGRAARTLRRAGTARLTVRLSARTATALRRARRLTVKVTATSTARGHRARSASRTVTLR